MSEQKIASKDVRAVAGISLIMNMEDRLKDMEDKLSKLGNTYVDGQMQKDVRDVQEIKKIMFTRGDPIANDMLVKSINKLEDEITCPRYLRYIPLIHKCLIHSHKVFRFSVAKHFQSYSKQEQVAMAQAFGIDSVVPEPQIHFLPNLKKKKKSKLSED
jgi:hypothetical protein